MSSSSPPGTAMRTAKGAYPLEYVERLRGIDRIMFWSKKDAMKSFRMRSNRSCLDPSAVVSDPHGHVYRMPLLIGRPCFGQPVAFLRTDGVLAQQAKSGRFFPTKCAMCGMSEACSILARKRLTSNDRLKKAWHEFLQLGGAVALQSAREDDRISGAFRYLINELRALVRADGDFRNPNDDAVIEYYDAKAAERLAEDARRKAKERKARLDSGALDSEVMDLLRRHRTYREALLARFLNHLPADAQSCFTKIPVHGRNGSAMATADAWFAREWLRAHRRDVNASAVAGVILEAFPRRYQGRTRNALRSRIDADLLRADRLATVIYSGRAEPVWPPFDLLAELAAEAEALPTAGAFELGGSKA